MLMTTGVALAQNFSDALRYSAFEPIGTARFLGSGSALSPLGADYSVMSTNPAGIAWMRKSEFMISPGLHVNTTSSRLSNGSGNLAFDDAAARFNLPNIGLVLASRGSRRGGTETVNFAVGLNRLADFNQQFFYEGASRGSLVQRFEELANDVGLGDLEAGMAFDAEALIDDNGFYFSDYTDFSDQPLLRSQTVTQTGGMSELSFGFAGNVQDKVLWGVALGIPFLEYTEEKIYTERDDAGSVPFFDELEYNEQLNATGSGVNLKLGVIFRVHQALRVSAAVHTPTYHQISENYSANMRYEYTVENERNVGNGAFSGSFNYGLRTPWRFMGGVGGIFGEHGFLTGEIEYVNYKGNRFLFEGFGSDEVQVNRDIDKSLSDAIRIRTGAEIALGTFRLRGGVGVQQAAIAGDDNFYTNVSLGVGVRQRNYFMDLGYRRQGSKTTFSPYLTTDAVRQFIDNDVVNENFVFTLGFRW